MKIKIFLLSLILSLFSTVSMAQSVSCLPTFTAGCVLTLRWTDTSTGEDNFRVERRVNGGVWSVIGTTTGPNMTTYVDTTVTQSAVVDNVYEYRVFAARTNNVGNSAYSNIATVTIPMVLPVLTAPTNVTVS